MKDDIERELNKAQIGGWLSRLDEEDERVGAIKKGFDLCIAECDELDRLLTLYGVELGVSAVVSRNLTRSLTSSRHSAKTLLILRPNHKAFRSRQLIKSSCKLS